MRDLLIPYNIRAAQAKDIAAKIGTLEQLADLWNRSKTVAGKPGKLDGVTVRDVELDYIIELAANRNNWDIHPQHGLLYRQDWLVRSGSHIIELSRRKAKVVLITDFARQNQLQQP